MPDSATSAKEQKREYDRLRWERDGDRLRQQQREKYARNREKYRKQANEYRRQNPELIKAQKAASYRRNRAEIRRRAAAVRRQNPGQDRKADLKKYHRIRPEDWAAMREAQGGRCYLCAGELSSDTKRVHVDHDHRCCPPFKSCRVCRRGLACEECNKAIGMAHDDPARLRRMADALEAAKRVVERRMADHAAVPLTLFP